MPDNAIAYRIRDLLFIERCMSSCDYDAAWLNIWPNIDTF